MQINKFEKSKNILQNDIGSNFMKERI